MFEMGIRGRFGRELLELGDIFGSRPALVDGRFHG